MIEEVIPNFQGKALQEFRVRAPLLRCRTSVIQIRKSQVWKVIPKPIKTRRTAVDVSVILVTAIIVGFAGARIPVSVGNSLAAYPNKIRSVLVNLNRRPVIGS